MPQLDFLAAGAKRQGEWAELRFAAAAMQRGLIVCKPYGDSARYDFLVDGAGRLSRVQVKSSRVPDGGAFRISCGRGPQSKISYQVAEVDVLAAYVIPHDAWYLIPIRAVHPRCTLYVCPHRPSAHQFEPYREAWNLLTGSAK